MARIRHFVALFLAVGLLGQARCLDECAFSFFGIEFKGQVTAQVPPCHSDSDTAPAENSGQICDHPDLAFEQALPDGGVAVGGPELASEPASLPLDSHDFNHSARLTFRRTLRRRVFRPPRLRSFSASDPSSSTLPVRSPQFPSTRSQIIPRDFL